MSNNEFECQNGEHDLSVARRRLGSMRLDSNRADVAEWSGKGIERAPWNADFLFLRGLVREAEGRAGEAESEYRSALKYNPLHRGARLELAVMLRGNPRVHRMPRPPPPQWLCYARLKPESRTFPEARRMTMDRN